MGNRDIRSKDMKAPARLITISGAVLAASWISPPANAELKPKTEATLFPLKEVRLLDSPFTPAVAANRRYLLAHDPDRLLAPFLREAGLEPKAKPYPNWESMGLDGHTAGHYLSALAGMIASGNDNDGALRKRLDHMLAEMDRVQKANGDGYIGGVPGSKELWAGIAKGDVGLVWKKWVPWYNVHKTYAGLRDAWLETDSALARTLLIRFGDWCVNVTSKLSDDQMQQMIGAEYGGMNESLADIYAITGDKKYLQAAERFNHQQLLQPLTRREDQLTGKHANTQIPKIIGFERIATLTGDQRLDSAARFFWETVTQHRSVAFGGNSVREHFNDPKDFGGMLEDREGPETCNTYNMLRLTEQLFAAKPSAAQADYYERALYNHLLSAIDPHDPGYVYFTPIRPGHYRVYSSPEECFWCCVGTGMENPGRYGQFIYAKDKDGIFVNLFIPSVLKVTDGFQLRQENNFPFEPRTSIRLDLTSPSTFTLHVRHPRWVRDGAMKARVNGAPVELSSKPSSYAEIRREWRDGDRIDIELPMNLSAERLPDNSDWAALLYGPIVLASPSGTADLTGERAPEGRMSHVAGGPLVPIDKVPVLLTTPGKLPDHVRPDSKAGPLHFRIQDVAEPKSSDGIPLEPFFSLHHQRYQMYWQFASAEELAAKRQRIAEQEREKAALAAATIDSVAIGEQQPEVEHDFQGEDTKTGIHEGRRWRDGRWFQYNLNTKGEKSVDLAIVCWGGDTGRAFDVLIGETRIASVELKNEKPGEFITRRFSIPENLLSQAKDGKLTVKFTATKWVAGGIFDLRFMKPRHDPR